MNWRLIPLRAATLTFVFYTGYMTAGPSLGVDWLESVTVHLAPFPKFSATGYEAYQGMLGLPLPFLTVSSHGAYMLG